jgi:DNA-binding beta-propeller fold protein YncE
MDNGPNYFKLFVSKNGEDKMRRAFLILIIAALAVTVFYSQNAVLAKTGGKGKPQEHPMRSPIRLALTPEGNLLVSDYQVGAIMIVDPKDRQVTRFFAVQGRPLGVAYAKGRIFVGNDSKGCIEVYNRAGIKLKNFVFSQPVQKPTDIAVDQKRGYVFVVDGAQKKVKLFNLKGKFIRSLPASNPNNQVLTNPTAVAVDPDSQEVFVSDYGDTKNWIWPKIQIFDYNGNLLDTIKGKKGMFGMRFSRPQGLAVDGAGHVFMVDCYSGEIMVFDRYNGNTLKTMAGYGTDPGQLRLPLDIVIVPSSKDIFVTNNRSATVEIFKNGGVL